MKLELLADNKDLIPVIASWYFKQWGHREKDRTLKTETDKLLSYLNKHEVPLMLLAMDNNEPVGAAQLKFREMSIYPEKEHWIGGVYVSKDRRGRGIARQIVRELITIAANLKIQILYLQTEDLNGGLYRDLGWEPIEQVHYQNTDVLVMERKITE